MKPRLLDLFSGIGGFSLGLERAGFRTVSFCEIDPWCRRVLSKHWPGVPCYDDVRELSAARLAADGIDRIDAICGGFPCQDISLAGKGAGLDGERSGLWREYARLVGELRPRFVIVENVGALRARGLARVLADLAALAYVGQAHAIPAAAAGAPHLRDRVWIIAADADDIGRWRLDPAARNGAEPAGGAAACLRLREPGAGQWSSNGQQRVSDPQREPTPTAAADTDSRRRECIGFAQHSHEQGAPRREPDGLGARGWRHGPAAAHTRGPGSSQLRGLFGRLARSLAAASTPWERTAEPPLCGLDDGVSNRLARPALKALGNAVVPQVVELIGRALLAGEVEERAAA